MRDFYDLTELGRARRLRSLAMTALSAYDLQPVRVRLITNETNGIFRIDTATGDRYVLRVGLGGEVGHSIEVVENEVAWLAALAAETELAVPTPLPTRDGAHVVTVATDGVPGPRNVVVFSWLAGPLLGDRLTPRNVGRYGAYAAALHRHGAQFSVPHPASLPRYDRVLPFEENDYLGRPDTKLFPPSRRRRFDLARRRVEAAIGSLDPAAMQILHGDFHPWNVKVHRGRIAAFDFEDLMWGWPIQDAATTLYYFHGDADYEGHRSAFEAGYRSVAEWPATRPDDVDVFLLGRALVLANYVLASPELQGRAEYWMGRFERRIATLLDGAEYRSED